MHIDLISLVFLISIGKTLKRFLFSFYYHVDGTNFNSKYTENC